jgi:hypothetical protein
MNIQTNESFEYYKKYLKSLNDEERSIEFDSWFNLMSEDYELNEFENKLLSYFDEWLEDYYWFEDSTNLSTLEEINILNEELSILVDSNLDLLNSGSESKKAIYSLLDEINESKKDCEDLINRFNKKIIDNDCK